ncbi:MAG: prenyltransferase [Candidatus Omnitrophota bacterium]
MDRLKIKNYFRALRFPFISVTVLPFVFGSFLEGGLFSFFNFFLGFFCAVLTHLGSNLINDYADSRSGADWQDRKFYGFFGGSKLIQEGVFSEGFYLKSAIFCFLVALSFAFILVLRLNNFSVLGYYFLIVFLGFFYSGRPFRFSYHRLGELVVFILFGPALVMGSSFIQTQIFPTLKGFFLSLPFGIFTTVILFANQVADYRQDQAVGKLTLSSLVKPENTYKLYYLLIFLGFFSIVVNIALGYLNFSAFLSLLFIFQLNKAATILRKHFDHKDKLVVSSRITIANHTFVSTILILSIIL